MILQNGKTLHIRGRHFSYVMIRNDEEDLLNFHFGAPLSDRDYAADEPLWREGFSAWSNTANLTSYPQEYPAFGGSDIEGPTALANSVAQLPNELMIGGQLLNIKFNPASFTSEQGIQNFLALLKGYFDKKGFQMQINVVDKATLLEAQHTPENYRDLMVRVAGYSAYFVSIDKDLQNDIIRRTEHNV